MRTILSILGVIFLIILAFRFFPVIIAGVLVVIGAILLILLCLLYTSACWVYFPCSMFLVFQLPTCFL